MKNIFLLSLFSLLFLAVRCPKNDGTPSDKTTAPTEVLPPATQNGAGTFGFLLNGKVWLPEGPGAMTVLTSQYYRGEVLLSAIQYVTNGTTNQTFSFAHKYIYKAGRYYFKYAQIGGAPSAEFTDFITNCDYVSNDQDSLNTYVNITKLDTISRIVSGTFNLLFVPPGSGCDTIKITNGRFDMKYEF